MPDLLVIVPSRGRPESVARLIEAWTATGAYDDGADLVFALDNDDPEIDAYRRAVWDARRTAPYYVQQWVPMVHKLDRAARDVALYSEPFAIGFAGDDHLPRTPGWAGRYVAELRDLGTGIVYGDDGYQGERLPTQWAMTSDIVRALGRMVPAPVEHLYCDNAILDLGRSAGCIRYLPDVQVEHMHPVAGKATTDAGYERVNSTAQFRRDRAEYRRWLRTGLAGDAATVRAIRESREPCVRS